MSLLLDLGSPVTLGLLEDMASYGYYLFLMATGSFIVWRIG